MSNVYGCPYPIVKSPLGYFATQTGVSQLHSDLLILLMTEPGERVMTPTYGTSLRKYLFEQYDAIVEDDVRDTIIQSITKREPRVTIQDIQVGVNKVQMSPYDDGTQANYVLGISIQFVSPENINNVQLLELQLPLNGGAST